MLREALSKTSTLSSTGTSIPGLSQDQGTFVGKLKKRPFLPTEPIIDTSPLQLAQSPRRT